MDPKDNRQKYYLHCDSTKQISISTQLTFLKAELLGFKPTVFAKNKRRSRLPGKGLREFSYSGYEVTLLEQVV